MKYPFLLLIAALPLSVDCHAELRPQTATDSSEIQAMLDKQQTEIIDLKDRIHQQETSSKDYNPLAISGFFDVTAHTTDNSDHPFDLGSLELDIEFDSAENFSVSSALVWDGDAAEVAVAVLDYHSYDQNVPARGQIFDEPGYHIQFGRFDIPFGIDYELFAAADRPNITAPLTTEHIQNGGFGGDGIRIYGNWSNIDYALYWTNSLFEDTGNSIGTRVGIFPGRDPFRVHKKDSDRNFVIGLSYINDYDADDNIRNKVSGLDITWRFSIAEITYEKMQIDNPEQIVRPEDLSLAGPANESGSNISLLLDFDPVSFYIGYGEWDPEFSAEIAPDDDTSSYTVSKLKRYTISGRYIIDDNLQIKLEYFSHRDTSTQSPSFEDERLTFQMVASF